MGGWMGGRVENKMPCMSVHQFPGTDVYTNRHCTVDNGLACSE